MRHPLWRPTLIANSARWVCMVGFASLVACGGSDAPTGAPPVVPPPPPPVAGSLTMSLVATSATTAGAAADAPARVTIRGTITRGGGFTGAVSLSLIGAPAGVVVPATVTLPAAEDRFAIPVLVTHEAPAADNTLTVRVAAPGATADSATWRLTVQPELPAPRVVSPVDQPIALQAAGATSEIPLVFAREVDNEGDTVFVTAAYRPPGVSVVVTPSSTLGDSTTITLSASLDAAVGADSLTLSLRQRTRTSLVRLPVAVTAPAPRVVLDVADTVAVVGTTLQVPVRVERLAGFTPVVRVALDAAPPGISAAPLNISGDGAMLTVVVAPEASPGVNVLSLRATADGAPDATREFRLTVTPAPSGPREIAYRFCQPDRMPTWFVVQDGFTGPWRRVQPDASGTFRFVLQASHATIVSTGGSRLGDRFEASAVSAQELHEQALEECRLFPPAVHVSGQVASLRVGDYATLNLGAGYTSIVDRNGSFTSRLRTDSVPSLVAVRNRFFEDGTVMLADRVLFRSDPAAVQGSLSQVIDFTAPDAVATETVPYTIENADNSNLYVTSVLFHAGRNAVTLSGATRGLVSAVPVQSLPAGTVHAIVAQAGDLDNQGGRLTRRFDRELVTRTLTFGPRLLPVLAGWEIDSLGRRPEVSGTWQQAYGDVVIATWWPPGTRSFTIGTTRSYLDARDGPRATYRVVVPDLSGAPGYVPQWLVWGAHALDIEVIASGSYVGTPIQDGYGFMSASRRTFLQP